ncbi:MAG: sigma 54-interacting transcriptional regulator [Spirochaetaceae bacterium]|jgi:transcriptional regulatory protein RtcR|nr:sigma 54-interacting transcriptional regulator [Spirochaetaceae bacterium]
MNKLKKNIVFSLLGHDRDMRINTATQLGRIISIFKHPEFPVWAFHVIYPSSSPEIDMKDLVNNVLVGISKISPETRVESHVVDFETPWDFKEVYARLYGICEKFKFNLETYDYYFHITLGTHVQQICIYLLSESRRFPGKLLQTYGLSPHRKNEHPGYVILDFHNLPISIKEYSTPEKPDNTTILKSGFVSVNTAYNNIIENLREVTENSREPILLLGETGTGKSVVARKIHEVKNNIFRLSGNFVEINCATVSKDLAIATLFGYKKGDYSGASHEQIGLLQQADEGMLFLDEIGELTLEVQAMLLNAIETKRFKVFGIHEEITIDFQLVCGTNRNLMREVHGGRFRDDLLSRINFWNFTLPPLRHRLDDLPNLVNFFIDEWSRENNNRVISFENDARKMWLAFATAPEALWIRNLRELNHSVKRMCYYSRSNNDMITRAIVDKEIRELQRAWSTGLAKKRGGLIPPVLIPHLHKADTLALEEVMRICRHGGSLSDAGRILFSVSSNPNAKNYSDLARKFLDHCTRKVPGCRFTFKHGKGLILRHDASLPNVE